MRPEDALQMAVCQYLKHALPSSAWFTAVPNGAVLAGEKRARQRQMAKLKATGLRVGCPDLILCFDGRFIGIEIKTPVGRLSDTQKACSDDIVAAQGLWTVCRSVDEVESYLRQLNVPLKASVRAAA